MWIYGYEDYKQENKYGNYDRVIIFHLLRSDVTLTIKDGEKYISQNVKCKEFSSDIITETEQERATREKSVIKFFAQQNIKQLMMGIPVIDIINDEKKGKILILKEEKLIVSKIEYARDKVVKEVKTKSDETRKIMIDNEKNPEIKRYLTEILGLYNYPRGNETIRFHITLIEEGTKQDYTVDIHINNESIKKIWSPGHFYEELKIIEYFCHQYFELLYRHIPIEEILKKDAGNTIIYKQNLSRELSENTLIQKVLTKLKK